jgi:hypothetical protein
MFQPSGHEALCKDPLIDDRHTIRVKVVGSIPGMANLMISLDLRVERYGFACKDWRHM